MIDLDPVKRDQTLFFDTLEIARAGSHCRCAFHKPDATGSMKVWCNEAGHWQFKCYGCGVRGDVIQALALKSNRSAVEVIRELRDKGAATIPSFPRRRPEQAEKPKAAVLPRTRNIPTSTQMPTPDKDRLIAFQEKAREEIERDWSEIREYGRGVSIEVARQYAVGFRRGFKFKEWPGMYIENAWCFPIPDKDGNIRAVKLHMENPVKGHKSMWCPFGTMPAPDPAKGIKPRHALLTWWPMPEWFDLKRPIILMPGELKALAAISLGRAAVAHTQGEGLIWYEEDARRFENRDVLVCYDDDNDKEQPDGKTVNAGHHFRDRAIAALLNSARSLGEFTPGKMKDYLRTAEAIRG